MKKIMLIYPPGKLYQRGEDRSQGNIEDSSATSMRAPNDLGYAASTLEEKGFDTFLKDYQSESLDLLVLKDDFIWITLYQIKQLLKRDYIVNPHVRSIISNL